MIIKKIGTSIVNAVNKQGESPLHKSIFNPQARLLLVDMLLRYRNWFLTAFLTASHGANVNKVNDKGETVPFHILKLTNNSAYIMPFDLVAEIWSPG